VNDDLEVAVVHYNVLNYYPNDGERGMRIFVNIGVSTGI
jgi:hypothetical protein